MGDANDYENIVHIAGLYMQMAEMFLMAGQKEEGLDALRLARTFLADVPCKEQLVRN